jgi:hypothetical protein
MVIGRGKVEWSLARERWNGHRQGKGGMVIGRGKVEWSLAGERWNGHWQGKGGMVIGRGKPITLETESVRVSLRKNVYVM